MTLLLFIIGITLIAAPFVAPVRIGIGPTMVMIAGGMSMLWIALIVSVMTRWYRRTAANMAFVRAGVGGIRVLIGGGANVFPSLHQVTEVSLEVARLETGPQVLATSDGRSVRLSAELHVQVVPAAESVHRAARSFGTRAADAQAMAEEMRQPLLAALRRLVASMTWSDVQAQRDKLGEPLRALAEEDLSAHGLQLASLAVTSIELCGGSLLQASIGVVR